MIYIVYIYTYMYIYIYKYLFIYIYIYIFIFIYLGITLPADASYTRRLGETVRRDGNTRWLDVCALGGASGNRLV